MMDWNALLGLAGIDPAGLQEADPVWQPLFPVDERIAWEGTYAGGSPRPFRIEAGGLGGKPVYFRVFDTGSLELLLEEEEEEETAEGGLLSKVLTGLSILMFGACVGLPAFFGWRNIRAGRADTGSAFRLGLTAGILAMASGTLMSSLTGSFRSAISQIFVGVALSLFVGTLMGLGYLAAEPYLRRYWPDLLISWTRLMAGRYRDPRVGRDILVGAATAMMVGMLLLVASIVPTWFGRPMIHPSMIRLESLMGGRYALGQFVEVSFVLIPMITVLILLLFLLIFRRKMIAVIVALGLMVLTMVSPGLANIESWGDLLGFMMGIGILVLGLTTLIRFGLLAYVTMFFFFFHLEYPFTFDTSAWYSSTAILALLAMVAVAVYAFRIATSGRTIEIPHDPQTAKTLR
jgi:hypothetical protein